MNLKTIGIVLIIIGAIALAYQGFSYSKNREVVRIGGASVSATTREHVSIPPWAGLVIVGVGVAMLVVGRKKA